MKKTILIMSGFALLAGCATAPTNQQYSQMNQQVPVYYKAGKQRAPKNYQAIRTTKNIQVVQNNTTPKRKLTTKDFSTPEKMSVYSLQQAALRAGANAVVGTTCMAKVANDKLSATVICQGTLARTGMKKTKTAAMTKKTKTAAKTRAKTKGHTSARTHARRKTKA